jgi:hypothetical protein
MFGGTVVRASLSTEHAETLAIRRAWRPVQAENRGGSRVAACWRAWVATLIPIRELSRSMQLLPESRLVCPKRPEVGPCAAPCCRMLLQRLAANQ